MRQRMSAGSVMPKLHLVLDGIALALLAACLAFPAWSQDVTATITGSIVDPTGASIVGAAVTAKDTERGAAYTIETSSRGLFNPPLVPCGTYDPQIGTPTLPTAAYTSSCL